MILITCDLFHVGKFAQLLKKEQYGCNGSVINSSWQFFQQAAAHLAASEFAATVGAPPELHNAPEVYFVCQYVGAHCERCPHYMELTVTLPYLHTHEHTQVVFVVCASQ